MFRCFFLIFLLISTFSHSAGFSSNVIATESARGTYASSVAKALSQQSEADEKELYNTFMLAREEMEKLIDQVGFTRGDVGMAYGIYFITLWEIANEKVLSEETELKVVQYWTTHLHEVGINDSTLGQNKDLFYDWLLHAPMVMVTLKEAAKQSNNKELLATLSQNAAQMFVFLTKYPASIIEVATDGSIDFNKNKLETFMKTGDKEEVRQFLRSTRSEADINAFLKSRETLSAPKKKRSKNYKKHVRDIYNSILLNNATMSLSTGF